MRSARCGTMVRQGFALLAGLGLGIPACAANLTPLEEHWLAGAMPVLEYAQQLRLPIDVVVQPQDAAGNAPIAMAYVDGRCKLVLSMRGNPEAATMLERVAPALQPAIMEAVAAHEMDHCWRHSIGAWHALPAGFIEARPRSQDSAEIARLAHEIELARREEGHADLAALAWTARRHPTHYRDVHAWLLAFRDRPDTPGGHHDTKAWVELAGDPSAFADAATPFAGVHALWLRGMGPPP